MQKHWLSVFVCVAFSSLSCTAFGFLGLCVSGMSCLSVDDKSNGMAVEKTAEQNQSLDFIESVIAIPSGETNIVYYAGASNSFSILVHETNGGHRFWHLKKMNLDKAISRDFSYDTNNWVVLKDAAETQFRHWDCKKEIVDFVDAIPQMSAIVKPESSWLQLGDGLSNTNDFVWLVNNYIVDTTLCRLLKRGDKVCTVQLYDCDARESKRIFAEARKSGSKTLRHRQLPGGLEYACWDNGKFVQAGDCLGEKAFCLDNEIVAPFKFVWDGIYAGLLPFNEEAVIRAYKERAEESGR